MEDSQGSTPPETSWSRRYEARRRVSSRFPTIWRLPVRRRWSDVLLEALGTDAFLDADTSPISGTFLDIGAGDRRVREHLPPSLTYQSLDPDPAGGHDYGSFDDVPSDAIVSAACALEWIEHLDLEEAERSLRRLHECMRPGAVIVLTTPNTYYPPAWFRDSTHRTAFCYDELGGLLELCGFEVVSCLRLYHAPFLQKMLRRSFAWVHRAIGIDYARQVAVVARRR